MGLFGNESKDVEKAMLKVQSVMALQQGISGVMGAIDSFQLLSNTIVKKVVTAFSTLKGAIISTGIGALVVLVGLLVANWDKVSDAISGATAESKAFAEAQDEINKQLTTAQESLISVKTAFDNSRLGVISKTEALKLYNEKLGGALGKTNDILEAEKRVKENEKNYLDSIIARAAAQVLLAKAAEASAKAASGQDIDLSFWDKLVVATVKGITRSSTLAEMTSTSLMKKNKENNQEIIDNSKAAYNNLITQAQQLEGKIGAEKINANYKTLEQIETDRKAAAQKEKDAREKKKQEDEKKALAEREAAKKFLKDQLQSEQEQADIQYNNRQKEDTRNDQEKADKLAKENQYWSDFEDKRLADAKAYEESHATLQEKWAKITAQQKLDIITNSLNSIADIIGKDTATGKAIAIATSLINTYQGITAGVKLGFPAAIPAVLAASATGFAAVKNIIKTKIPGEKGAGVSVPSAPTMPNAPLTPQAQSTRLDQGSINAIGQASARSYVLESDITSGQERIQRLNRAARIN